MDFIKLKNPIYVNTPENISKTFKLYLFVPIPIILSPHPPVCMLLLVKFCKMFRKTNKR